MAVIGKMLPIALFIATTSQDLEWHLGFRNEAPLTAVIHTESAEGSEVTVTLRFYIGSNGSRKLVATRNLGASFGAPKVVACFPFLEPETDRDQLFVSTTYGRVCSWLFDFDGVHVKKLYERDSGRIDVYPAQSKSGKWYLVEAWPWRRYQEDFLHQSARESKRKDYVLRNVYVNARRPVHR